MAEIQDLTQSWQDLFRNSSNLGYHPAVLVGSTMNLDGQRNAIQTALDYLGFSSASGIQNVNVGVNAVSTQNIQDLAVTNAKISSLTADKISAGTINSNVIYAGTISATKITAGTLQSGVIYAGDIKANQIKTETLTVGGGGAAAIHILHSDKNNAIVNWEDGSAIWEDASGALGIWGHNVESGIDPTGLALYASDGSLPRLALKRHGNQSTIFGGLQIQADEDGGNNLNVQGDTRIEGLLKLDADKLQFSGFGSRTFSLRDQGLISSSDGSNNGVLTWERGANLAVAPAPGSNISVNGHVKPAIVPVDDGYKALYCIESPEVWFVDFAIVKRHPWWKFWEKDQYIVDGTFMKTIVAPLIFTPTLNKNVVQVWGKRKDFDKIRMQDKTKEEFDKNNEFWSKAEVH